MNYGTSTQLTAEIIDELKPGIFATGTISDNPEGVNMTNSGRLLRWVAVRGYGPDWAVYVHWAENDTDYVAQSGDKVCTDDNVHKLIYMDESAFERYRY